MRVAVLWIVLAMPALAFGQQPSVSLQLDTRVLELGESVDAQLVCTNTDLPERPTLSQSPGLSVRLINASPYSTSRTTVINGKVSQTSTYTYQLRITGMKPGRHTLPAIAIQAGGQRYVTEPVVLTVRKSEASKGSRGDQLMWVELQARPEELYLSQTCTVTMRIGIRKVVIDGRVIPMNLLRDVLDQRASEFSIFGEGESQSTRGTSSLVDSNGQRNSYEIFRFTRVLRADEINDGRIGPVFLKGNFPTRVRRGFFDRYEVVHAKKVTARADALPINIKTPPVDDRPDDYTGAIGRFKLNVSAKPARVEQGQPVTLTVTLRGQPIAGVPGPDLRRHADLVSRFDFTKDELVGDVARDTKTFRRALFPKQAGKQTIPPISWSYFDVENEQYVTLTSDPIDIMVDPPSAASTLIEPLDVPGGSQAAAPTTLTVLAGGISPNYVDADDVLASHALVWSPPWVAGLAVPPVLWLVIMLLARHRDRLRGDAGFARKRRAARRCEQRMADALARGPDTEQLAGVAAALAGYVSDRLKLSAASPTPQETREALARHINQTSDAPGDAALVDSVCAFLEQADAARYMPGVTKTLPPADAVGKVREWIRQLERLTR